MSKLKNNAIAPVQGITYQNLVALRKCFELLDNQTLYIEIYGDVTVEDESQTEVKHEQGYLNNLSHSFWKTISNWLDYNDSEFDSYTEFVLLTTQKLSSETLFRDFNKKNLSEKMSVLEVIYNEFIKSDNKGEKTKGFLTAVMSVANRDKLKSILDKFSLITDSPSYTDMYNTLCQTHASSLPEGKGRSYIEALIGYITNQIARFDGRIDYEGFTEQKRLLTQQFMSSTFVFPATHTSYVPTEKERSEALELAFVRKIHDIEYYEEVGVEAIEHFYRQRKTVSEEMRGYETRDYKSYEDSLESIYKSTYRMSLLEVKKETQIKDSKKLYNKVLSSPVPQFQNYNDTPVFFRNGYLHELINENDNMLWKLEVDD